MSFGPIWRKHLRNYVAAVAVTAAMVFLRWLVDPWMGPNLPFTTLFAAVTIVAAFGGPGPALIPLIGGFLVSDYLFGEPRGTLGLYSHREWLDLLLYVASSGILLFVADVMRRAVRSARRANEELRRASERLQSLVDHTPLAVIEWDSEFRITRWSGEAERIFGWTAAEMIGCKISESGLAHDGDAGKVASVASRLRQGRERFVISQNRNWTKDGRILWCEWYNSVLSAKSGNMTAVLSLVLDVTGRQATLDTLRKQNERLGLLGEAAGVLLATDAPETMLNHVLERVAAQFDVDVYAHYLFDPTTETLRLSALGGISGPQQEAISSAESGQFICGTVAKTLEPLVVMHIQQSEDPMFARVRSCGVRSYVCNPLLVEDRLIGTLSFGRTTRDTFDQEELDFFQTISRYVALAYERGRLLEELREQGRRKDEFLATLAHELRNPLAPIRNSVQLLRLRGPMDPLMERSREIIDRQVSQLTRLVDDLLDVSRISRGKMQLRVETVELPAVVETAIETARPLIEEAGHELSVSLPPGPVQLRGDAARLSQVMANLLTNAAKYTEKRGRIWLTAVREGAEVAISVRDTGVGLAPEHRERIFEMFSQISPARDQSQPGLGIGLALVKGLVELHGGTVEVRSGGLGKGSEFIVRLPAEQISSVDARAGSDMDSGFAAEACRVLVVDDNRDGADTLTEMLRASGHTVEVAYDGLEAIQAAAAFRPHVILLDIGMPKMNGYEVARRVRQEPWGRDVMLVAITGWGQEDDRRRALDSGFDEHYTKPVDPAAVGNLLGQVNRFRPSLGMTSSS